MIQTDLCDLLGIQYPILQGGMAWVADASLASAVSEAGGLGVIGAGNAPVDIVREEIRKLRALTDKPFAVNIMLMSPFAEDIARLVVDLKVPVVTTGAGSPGRFMAMWNEAKIKVIQVVASVAYAMRVARQGAFAVVAEGSEAGGHIGELTTMALIPQVVDSLSIPVIAAGGIADGRGVAASLMLGASGVQCGTCFLVAHECTIHPYYKARVLKARDIDTVASGRRLGHPVRSLRSAFTHEYLKMENDPSVSPETLERFGEGALRLAVQEGDDMRGCFLSGQIAGLVKEEQSAKAIIETMFQSAEQLLKGAPLWVR